MKLVVAVVVVAVAVDITIMILMCQPFMTSFPVPRECVVTPNRGGACADYTRDVTRCFCAAACGAASTCGASPLFPYCFGTRARTQQQQRASFPRVLSWYARAFVIAPKCAPNLVIV